jgi:hypothetical protein
MHWMNVSGLKVCSQYSVHKIQSQFDKFHYNIFFIWLFKYLEKILW